MKIIKENERQKIILIENDNKKFIKRYIYDDKWEFYKTLQKINHPNIPKIINVESDGDTVVTEEYIEGKSISTLINENYVFKKKQIKNIVNQLISAISELHKFNIIHKDIKPDNIIMNDSGHIWLIDYDIARIYRDEIRKDTEIMGTFGYAPIEQYGMMPTDFKTDIYSFGVTLIKLLEYSGIKSSLKKIAKKCMKLDPEQRYKNTEKLKNAIRFRFFKNPLLYIILLIPVIIFVCVNYNQKKDIPGENKKVSEIDESIKKTEENIEEEYIFSGFEEYEKIKEYSVYPTFSHTIIFKTDEPCEHLLFIDDVNLKGKIKLGKNNTLVDSDIALEDGVLSVNLKDSYGNEFNNEFKYENQYEYEKIYTSDLRKNADIICRDINSDDIPEILIGINEGIMDVENGQFFNWFNYSIGWCIKYDEEKGFILCEGDMFSKGSSFNLTKFTDSIVVNWEDVTDIMEYRLIDNELTGF